MPSITERLGSLLRRDKAPQPTGNSTTQEELQLLSGAPTPTEEELRTAGVVPIEHLDVERFARISGGKIRRYESGVPDSVVYGNSTVEVFVQHFVQSKRGGPSRPLTAPSVHIRGLFANNGDFGLDRTMIVEDGDQVTFVKPFVKSKESLGVLALTFSTDGFSIVGFPPDSDNVSEAGVKILEAAKLATKYYGGSVGFNKQERAGNPYCI